MQYSQSHEKLRAMKTVCRSRPLLEIASWKASFTASAHLSCTVLSEVEILFLTDGGNIGALRAGECLLCGAVSSAGMSFCTSREPYIVQRVGLFRFNTSVQLTCCMLSLALSPFPAVIVLHQLAALSRDWRGENEFVRDRSFLWHHHVPCTSLC